jgi:hypothetical protein
MSRADAASRNRPSHIDLQLPGGKTPRRRILPRSDGVQGLRRLSLRRTALSGHCALAHDAHPPRLRPRKKHRSRRASNTATAAPIAHTV